MITYSLLGHNGRLGNQLWQIASSMGIATKSCDEVRFPRWSNQPFFSVPEYFFVENLNEARDLSPDYLQDINHWSRWEYKIKDYFQPPDEICKAITGFYGEDLVSCLGVHVRRGDYMGLPDHHPFVGLEYLEKAISSFPKVQLMVYSDEIEWCKQQSIFSDAIFADPGPISFSLMDSYVSGVPEEVLDLHTMARNRYHIISNSTFSWWAAFLGESSRVIYPERWFGPALAYIDTTLMFDGLVNWEAL